MTRVAADALQELAGDAGTAGGGEAVIRDDERVQQMREDAAEARKLAESRRALAEKAIRSDHLVRSADLFERADLYDRLASYSEELARLREGVEALRDRMIEAAKPTDSPFPAFAGIESASQVYADELTALLAEG